MKNKINKKGSALLTVLVIMTVLVVVGMGVISNSMNNLTATDVVTVNERSYYASENAAQVAISTIKNEVSQYYMTMKNSSSYTAYQALYSSFFTYLQGRLVGENSILAEPDFVQNELDGKTTVTCTMNTPTTQSSGYLGTTFNVTCTTTIDGVSRTVRGSLRVDAAPLKYQWTSAPALTDSMLLLGGNTEVDCEGTENHLTVSGTATMGGEVVNPCGFSATSLNVNNAYVEDLLIWKLFYNQFDKSIANPSLPTPVTPGTASNKYYFDTSTIIDQNIGSKNIYCAGDLTIEDVQVNNCDIYVAGNFYLNNAGDPDRLKGSNVYVEGNMVINASNFWSNGHQPMYYYAGGNISIILGQGGHGASHKSGRIEDTYMTAGGNITITSAYADDQDDVIDNSAFYAGGSIAINGQSYLDNPLIDQINNCTFEAASGDISIVSTYMKSNNKITAGDDVIIATYGMNNTEIYANDNIIIDSSRLYMGSQTQYYSSNCILAAQDDLQIINSSFTNSYFYSGENLMLELASGYSIKTSLMYSEEDAIYDNSWSGSMDTMQSSLIYTNENFYYSASGTATSSTPAGVQVMAKGNVYSLEDDDSSDAKDILVFGEGAYMNLAALQAMIGNPNSNTGSLADVLDGVGFEHTLPEPIITMPYYSEVYISEIYN